MKLPLLRKMVCYKYLIELILLQKTGRLVKSSNYAKKVVGDTLAGAAGGIPGTAGSVDPRHRGIPGTAWRGPSHPGP